jgi:hypothetical protein
MTAIWNLPISVETAHFHFSRFAGLSKFVFSFLLFYDLNMNKLANNGGRKTYKHIITEQYMLMYQCEYNNNNNNKI